MDEQCKTTTLFSVDGPIKKLFYLEKRDVLAVITDTLVLSQYTQGPEEEVQESMKVCRISIKETI